MASTTAYDLVDALKDDPNTSNALVPNETDYHLTTTINNYLVELYTDSAATVTVNGTVVVNGAMNPQLVIATTYSMVWEGDRWRSQGRGAVAVRRCRSPLPPAQRRLLRQGEGKATACGRRGGAPSPFSAVPRR